MKKRHIIVAIIISVLTALSALLFTSCGKNVHEHEWGKWEPFLEEKCYVAGQERSVCSICGAAKYREIAAHHTFDEGEINIARGVKVFTCSVCGDKKTVDLESGDVGIAILRLGFAVQLGGNFKTDVTFSNGEYSYIARAEVAVTGAEGNKPTFTLSMFDESGGERSEVFFPGWSESSSYFLDPCRGDATFARGAVSHILFAQITGSDDRYAAPVALYDDAGFVGVYTASPEAASPRLDKNFAAAFTAVKDTETTRLRAIPESLVDAGFELRYNADSDNLAIADSFRRMISFSKDSYGFQFAAGAAEHVDVARTVDYMIFSLISGAVDSTSAGITWATLDGAVWAPIPTSLRGTWGIDGAGRPAPLVPLTPDGAYNALWEKTIVNLRQNVYDRWAELREGALSLHAIEDAFAAYASRIPDNVRAADAEKWGYGNDLNGALSSVSIFADASIGALDSYFGLQR